MLICVLWGCGKNGLIWLRFKARCHHRRVFGWCPVVPWSRNRPLRRGGWRLSSYERCARPAINHAIFRDHRASAFSSLVKLDGNPHTTLVDRSGPGSTTFFATVLLLLRLPLLPLLLLLVRLPFHKPRKDHQDLWSKRWSSMSSHRRRFTTIRIPEVLALVPLGVMMRRSLSIVMLLCRIYG